MLAKLMLSAALYAAVLWLCVHHLSGRKGGKR
jgi:hypothetical protein